MTANTETMDNSYMVHIKSKDVLQLTNGFNTDMLIDLAAPIQRENSNQDMHISLSSAEIPVSFYAFSSQLNNLNIFVDGVISLVIEEGNYDVFEMMTAINAVGAFPYVVTYDVNKAKYTLTNSDATLHILNFGDVESRGLAKALGFSRTNQTVGAGLATTSDGVVNFQTIHSIFLFSDLNIENVITTGETVNNLQPIIDKIPIKDAPFSVIHYSMYDTAPFSSKIDSNVIRTFKLALRDQNNNLIQMNGVNFELSLLFEIHNKPNKITIEKDVIIDKSVRHNRRSLEIPTIIEHEEIAEIEQPPILRRMQSERQIIPELNLPPPASRPQITERTIIKKEVPIKRLNTINDVEEIKDDDLKGDLLDAVLQAQLLSV